MSKVISRGGNSLRVGILSTRNIRKHVCRCWGYELEDTIALIEGAEIVAPRFTDGRFNKAEPKVRRFFERIFDRRFYSEPQRVEQIELRNQYDVFFAFCQEPNDIRLVTAIKNWRSKCRVSICWLDEVWLDYAKRYPKQIDLLREFDHVFITLRETVDYLKKIGIPNVYHIAPGVDTIRFSPYPHMPRRTIDVMAMGRRAPNTHQAFLDLAESGQIHYLYDSSPLLQVNAPNEHRSMSANQIKRSRFFLVQKAKADTPGQTNGQDEVGSRFFEGCAGGAVLLGDSPKSLTMDEQFPWEDAVVHLPYESNDVSFLMDPQVFPRERLEAIHRQNSVQSLQRHDWAYRWEYMLNTAGLGVSNALKERKEQLAEFADGITNGKGSSSWLGKQATYR